MMSDLDKVKELFPNISDDVLSANGFPTPNAKNGVKVKSLNQNRTNILEKDFTQTFDDLASLRGWTWCGFRPARQKINGEEQYRTPLVGQKGLGDRILARLGIVLIIELKTDSGRLSEGQKIWASALKGFKGYYVLRPSDWDFIEKLLE